METARLGDLRNEMHGPANQQSTQRQSECIMNHNAQPLRWNRSSIPRGQLGVASHPRKGKGCHPESVQSATGHLELVHCSCDCVG